MQYLSGVSLNTPMYAWEDPDPSNIFISWIIAVAQSTNPPLVISMSYGEYENLISDNNKQSWDTQAIKLGLQGVTLVVSSGDTGVSGQNAQPGAYNTTACGYASSFPASSPYVLSVGATQGYPIQVPSSCGSRGAITTGGGFSQYYPAPYYQVQANVADDYFKNVEYQPYTDNSYIPSCPSCSSVIDGNFNSSNRGYPDLVAWSSFVNVIIGHYYYYYYYYYYY